jgi:hypothetical protein
MERVDAGSSRTEAFLAHGELTSGRGRRSWRVDRKTKEPPPDEARDERWAPGTLSPALGGKFNWSFEGLKSNIKSLSPE